jgi:hypothetical protein
VSHATAFGQLRVLSGWHQGACVDLNTAAGELSLGSDVTNDVVLRDAPFAQARVLWQTGTWRLAQDDAVLELPHGQALAWTTLRLVIDESSAPWDYPNAQPWPVPASIDEPVDLALAAPERTEALAAEPIQPLPDNTVSGPEGMAIHGASWLRRMGQRRSARLGLVGLCSMLTVAAVAAWTQLHHQTPQALPPNLPLEMATPHLVDQAQLQAVIEKAGLKDVVRVEKADGQRHALLGVVQDQDQLEALLRDVMVLTRKVIPHLLVQREFEAHVQSLQSLLPPGMQIAAEAGGQVWLTSDRHEASELQEAVALVRRELPEAVQVRTGTGMPRPALAQISPMAGLPPIVAFQSGPQAYVLLANGERILPGGQLKHLRLIRIEDQALVLEDAEGQTRRFER